MREREFMIFRIFKRIFLAAFAVLFLSNSCSAAIMVDGKPLQYGTEVALKTVHNRWVTAGGAPTYDTINSQPADTAHLKGWEKLTLIDPNNINNKGDINNGAPVLIYSSAHKKYIMAWDAASGSKVTNSSTNAKGSWERFIIQDLGGGKIAFKTAHNKFLNARSGDEGWKFSQRDIVGRWGEFEIVRVGSTAAPVVVPPVKPVPKPAIVSPVPAPVPVKPAVVTPVPAKPGAKSSATSSVIKQKLEKAGFSHAPGALSQISCGKFPDGKMWAWGVNANQQLYQWNASKNGWDKVPRTAGIEVSVGDDGDVWHINANYKKTQPNIYHRASNGAWSIVSGMALNISVGNKDNVWIIGTDKAPYKWTGNWSRLPYNLDKTPLKQISVGGDGAVWALAEQDGRAYKLVGNKWIKSTGFNLIKIAVGNKDNVYGTTSGGLLWGNKSPGFTADLTDQWTLFKKIEGLKDITINNAKFMWVLTNEAGGNIFYIAQAPLIPGVAPTKTAKKETKPGKPGEKKSAPTEKMTVLSVITIAGKPLKADAKVYLKSAHNKYLSARDAKEQWNVNQADNIAGWEKWTISKDGDKFVLKSAHNKYLSARMAAEKWNVSQAGEVKGWEKWIIGKAPSGKYVLKSPHNKYLSARMAAEKWNVNQTDKIAGWEEWEIGKAPKEPKKAVVPTKPTKLVLPKGFKKIDGGLTMIDLGFSKDGKPLAWAINAAGQVYEGKEKTIQSGMGMSATTSTKFVWTRKSAGGKGVSVGADGTICALHTSGTVYDVVDGKWISLGGNFDQVSVGNRNEIWAKTGESLHKYNSATKKWDKKFDGFRYFSVGADGTIWGILKDSRGARIKAGTTVVENSLGTGLIKISCGNATNVWALTNDGKLWMNSKADAAVAANKYIADSWQKVSGSKWTDVTVNSGGYVAILGSKAISGGHPVYYKAGGARSAITPAKPTKAGEKAKPGVAGKIAPALTPTQALAQAAAKPALEKLAFYQEIVDWAKNNKKVFNPTEQNSFVWTHMWPLYNAKQNLPKEHPDLALLMKVLKESHDYAPMVGNYATVMQSSMINPLKAKGIVASAIVIPATAKFADLLSKALAKKDLAKKIATYKAIVSWAKSYKKVFKPAEQSFFVWNHLWPLYMMVNAEGDATKKKALQANLLALLIKAKAYAPLVGSFVTPVQMSMIKPLQKAGVAVPGKKVKPAAKAKPAAPARRKVTPRRPAAREEDWGALEAPRRSSGGRRR